MGTEVLENTWNTVDKEVLPCIGGYVCLAVVKFVLVSKLIKLRITIHHININFYFRIQVEVGTEGNSLSGLREDKH